MTTVQHSQDAAPAEAPTNPHLRAAVLIAHEARQRYASAKEVIDAEYAKLELALTEWLLGRDAAKAAVEQAEAQLRELAEAHYKTTGEKKPVPGVEIKLVTEVAIVDPKAALDYAKHTGLCVKLDEASYKNLAKTNDVPGTTVTEVPKASIARDLAAAIGAGAQ